MIHRHKDNTVLGPQSLKLIRYQTATLGKITIAAYSISSKWSQKKSDPVHKTTAMLPSEQRMGSTMCPGHSNYTYFVSVG